ncbi:hypothetical protein M0804_007644 [Polistes exclamans]|nr:hypothetical protein M0804_007644 [Polistes exclamans]
MRIQHLFKVKFVLTRPDVSRSGGGDGGGSSGTSDHKVQTRQEFVCGFLIYYPGGSSSGSGSGSGWVVVGGSGFPDSKVCLNLTAKV